ncbi:KAP family NTPase [Serratia sp. BIGb0163]|uniref:KAP family NTPase n=1 Tax=Serratia sp. BIGb0163 TaxID=2940613 RepID=UPI002167304D|nr:KAP family NTPase [Serratia sp. BIGb0163]MCS4268271.1 hypothetical protein [Serratia sp. BIGb0163]
MSFILHTETPSLEDKIDGNSHKNIAIKIADALNNDNLNIIGINGPLGSGKSTVIKILEQELADDNFNFINFDAEIYQQGSTKKALITKIYDGILPKIPHSLKRVLEEHKDSALGNSVTYKKIQDSEISLWAVLFIASIFICSQSIRPLQLEWGRKPEDFSLILGIALITFLISPLIVLVAFILRSIWDKSLKIGNLIKRNSVDTITEKMLVSKEVGSIELHNAISGFKECIPPGLKFLLVIDNLDRISPEKVKEIWSDIELISNSSEKRLKLLIPYSSEHVAKSLSNDPYEGREYISKRIPISFQIPPILSAGWRNAFSNYWKESFPEDKDHLYHDTSELIEIWLPESYQPVTPRYLKKLVNDIQIISVSTPVEVKNIACAYYILTTKQNERPFSDLLIENFDNHELDKTLIDKFKKSIRKLQRIYGNDRQNWVDELLCINYQTNATLAQGELIDEPLKIALKQANSDDLSRVSDMFGFHSAWRRIIDSTDPTDWFVTLSKIPTVKKDMVREILPEVIRSLDTLDETSASTIDNDNFLPALNHLKESGFEVHGKYIDILKNRISKEILSFTSLDDDSLMKLGAYNPEIQRVISQCDLMAKLINENILNDIYPQPESIFYILNLKDKSQDFLNLKITDYKLKPESLIHGLQYSYEHDINIRLTDPDIDRHAIFENPAITSIIKDGSSPQLDAVYSNFTSNSFKSVFSFEVMVLIQQWHTSNLTSYYNKIISSTIDWKNECIAHFIAQMVSSKTISSIESYKNQISDELMLISNLSCYLKYISDFSRITDALTEETLNEYLIPAIDILAHQDELKINNIKHVVTKSFSTLGKYLNENTLDKFTKNNEADICNEIEDQYIKVIDKSLVSFILKGDTDTPLVKSLISSFEYELDSQERFNETAIAELTNYINIASYAKNKAISFPYSKDFIANFFSSSNVNEIDRVIPRLTFDTLNDDDKNIALRKISDLIYMREIDVKRQVILIKHFGDLLIYNDEEITSGSRSISRLFDMIQENPFIASWLDVQNINFVKWNRDDKNSAIAIIVDNIKLFPTLREKTAVKNKLRTLSDQGG